MMPTQPSDELQGLLADLIDGTASAERQLELRKLIQEDTASRDYYIAFMSIHTALVWKHGGVSNEASREQFREAMTSLADSPEKNNLPLPLGSKEGPPSDQRGDRPDAVAGCEALGRGEGMATEAAAPTPRSKSLLDRASRHPLIPSIGVAMVVLVAFVLGLALTPMKEWIAGEGRQHEGPTDSEYVAILNGRKDVTWLEGTRPSLSDPRLAIGQRLVFAKGAIEVKYDTGAKVVIEGPAEFTVGRQASGDQAVRHQEDDSRGQRPADAKNSGYLKLGSLVARVEGKEAQGFTIHTPSARIEDLGTEFGVEVNRSGAAEVVVLDGRVDVVREESPGVVAQRVQLTKDQGAFVASSGRGSVIKRREKVDAKFIAVLREKLNKSFSLEQDAGALPNKLGRVTSGVAWPTSPAVETWNPTESSDTGNAIKTDRNPAQSFQFTGGALKLDKIYLEYRNGGSITVTIRIFPVDDVNQVGNSSTPSEADVLTVHGVVLPAPKGDDDLLEIDLLGAEEVTLPELTGTAGYVLRIEPETNGPEWTFKNPGTSNPYANGRAFRDDFDMTMYDFSLAIVGTIVPEQNAQQDETP